MPLRSVPQSEIESAKRLLKKRYTESEVARRMGMCRLFVRKIKRSIGVESFPRGKPRNISYMHGVKCYCNGCGQPKYKTVIKVTLNNYCQLKCCWHRGNKRFNLGDEYVREDCIDFRDKGDDGKSSS